MSDATHRGLSPHELAVLDFEREWFTLSGSKEANIRARLRISPTTYYRTLQAIVDRRAAFVHDPLTVTRVRRQRDERRRIRIEGRRADPSRR
jgi:hypothetical protein